MYIAAIVMETFIEDDTLAQALLDTMTQFVQTTFARKPELTMPEMRASPSLPPPAGSMFSPAIRRAMRRTR